MDNFTAPLSQDWLPRVERDVLALGGVVFYVLTLGRGLVGPFWDLVVPLVVIGAVLLVSSRWLHGVDLYLTRGLVLAVLVTNHYGDAVFGLFAAAVFGFMIFAAWDLGGSRRAVVGGLVTGAIGALVGYAMAVPFS